MKRGKGRPESSSVPLIQGFKNMNYELRIKNAGFLKKLVMVFVCVLILNSGFLIPVHTGSASSDSFYYVFHLYYDNGQLSADRDFKFKYDVIPGDFIADSVTTQFPYRGEVVNFVGETAGRFDFDPKQGDPKFIKGKISVNAPYFADAQKVIFYDNQNQPVLTIFVSDSSFCNDDGICNADRGEDSLNCSKDCKNILSAPVATPIDTAPTSGSSGVWSSILYILGGLILAGLVWWWFFKRRSANTLPTIMPPSNPTNNV